MPSPGAVNAMIVDRAIESGIQEKFGPQTRKDAYRLLGLADRGGNGFGNWVYRIQASFLVGWCIGFIFFVVMGNPIPAIVSGTIAWGVVLFLMIKSMRRARKEFDALVESNPNYWKPIAERLRQIVLDAGAINDPLFGKIQVTKVNDKNLKS